VGLLYLMWLMHRDLTQGVPLVLSRAPEASQ
jgi:hypothetical protein